MREQTTVVMSEMADRLNKDLELKPKIAQSTPYDWWKRTKNNQISQPMPKPIRMIGTSPVFLWRDVVRWYKLYAEEE